MFLLSCNHYTTASNLWQEQIRWYIVDFSGSPSEKDFSSKKMWHGVSSKKLHKPPLCKGGWALRSKARGDCLSNTSDL